MTMKSTALIAEDEPLLATHLRNELQRQWPQLDVVATVGHGQAAVDQALALRPAILFLDVRMPGLSGLEAAQALAEEWPEGEPLPLLVFVTAYDQYALQAFEQAAVDYLLKPVQPDRLAQTCSRLQEVLRQRSPAQAAPAALDATLAQLRHLLVNGSAPTTPAAAAPLSVIQASVGNAIHMVKLDEVVYFEAADKYVRVVTSEREYLIRTSLRELLPQLDTRRFWQIHRGTVVRAQAINAVTRDEAGKTQLCLRGLTEKFNVSRLYSHLFKAM